MPDWKITTATTWNGQRSASTDYYKGSRRRTDNPQGASVIDGERARHIVWVNDRREYVVYRIRYVGWTPRPSAPEVVIEQNTTDTGERRTFFGHEARHLITRETRGGNEESVTDGWYVQSDELPSAVRAAGVYVLRLAGKPPRIRLHRTGPTPSGLMVLGRKTAAENTWTFEVTDLFQGVLPDGVFQPPPGFTRVIQFPGDQPLPLAGRLRRSWEMLEDWVSGRA